MVIPNRMVSYSTKGLNISLESSMMRFWKMLKCFVSIHYQHTNAKYTNAYNAKCENIMLCSIYHT